MGFMSEESAESAVSKFIGEGCAQCYPFRKRVEGPVN